MLRCRLQAVVMRREFTGPVAVKLAGCHVANNPAHPVLADAVNPVIEENGECEHLFVALIAVLHSLGSDVAPAVIGTSQRDVFGSWTAVNDKSIEEPEIVLLS
jgi:hypothetical protein